MGAIATGCTGLGRTAATFDPAISVPPDPTPIRPDAGLPSPVPRGPLERATVVRIVDGDTIIIDRGAGSERLRYIGIDTPESVIPDRTPEPFSVEAGRANATLLGAHDVFLERDVSETDRFGRLLRYVWIRDGTDPGGWVFVNLALVVAGWATVTTFPPDVRHADLFRAAQRQARDADRGIWSPGPLPIP